MIGLLITLIAGAAAQASPDAYSGRWTYQDSGESVVLALVHHPESGRVTGALTIDGSSSALEGRIRTADVLVEKIGGLPLSVTGVSMVAMLDGANLVVVTSTSGETPETFIMTPPPVSAKDASRAASSRRGPRPEDFEGRWEIVSEDAGSRETLELTVAGDTIHGTLIETERGPSANGAMKGRFVVNGSFGNGSFEVTIQDSNLPGKAVAANIFRRNKFLIIQVGENERGYARPGQKVVESATGMVEAASLERAIAGRVYSNTAEAIPAGLSSGQNMQLRLCSDRNISWSMSDLTPFPGTSTWRGTWSIVLLAGAPAVRAEWQGIGSSEARTEYFMIHPSDSGQSAVVDGMKLSVTGTC